MTSGSLETLHATKKLAAGTLACPPWCDHLHDRTGDDGGISHERVIIGPLAHRCVEAYLRAIETVDRPGILGPVSLAVFSTEPDQQGPGWFLEVAIDGELSDLHDAVASAMALIAAMPRESAAVEPAKTPARDRAGRIRRSLLAVAG